jgi:hypothetical protein
MSMPRPSSLTDTATPSRQASTLSSTRVAPAWHTALASASCTSTAVTNVPVFCKKWRTTQDCCSGAGGSAKISGVTSSSFTVPNQTPPASPAEFCADPASNPNLVGLKVQNGVTLTITGCSFANNVGAIQATVTVSGISVSYVVRFLYGS